MIKSPISFLSIIVTFLSVPSVPTSAKDSPILIKPQDSRIAELYIALLDRDLDEALKHFDPQTGMVQVKKSINATFEELETDALNQEERKQLAHHPDYLWSYGCSRQTAELAGALAYAYSFPQSKYHKKEETRLHIQAIFDAFASKQAEDGEFVFSPIHYSSVWGTHEMAWRLEPLICAYEIIQSDLTAEHRKRYRAMLEKAMQFLLTHEQSSMTNRGMVWCSVMSLCHRFTGEKRFLDEAERVFQWVRRIFADNGEIREGPGPDLGYSTISLQYLFLYRLMSGNTELDEMLIRSLKWYTRLFTSQAIPLEGMSTRQWQTNGNRVSRILGALTFYADREPSFAQIATRYLQALMESPAGFAIDHGGGYFLRGAEYHVRPQRLETIPYEPYAQLYESDHSLYFLIGRNYQTAVVLRGRQPLKGMQTWSYQGQPPLIFPSKILQSRVVGFGYDSHVMDVGWNLPQDYQYTSVSERIDALIYRQGELISAYLFSQDTTTAIFRSKTGSGYVDWVHHLSLCAEIDQTSENMISFKNSDARILLPNAVPSATAFEDTLQLRLDFKSEFCWFGFTGPQSSIIVQPVFEGLVLVQINEAGTKQSILFNLSEQPFTKEATFPGTKIHIPPLPAFGAIRMIG
ncbi:MAG: hypothetical protein C4527_20235 [Candidatus Omnitrophota bacterium]|jgi:hypothetical protein|nr:MAG: hypothetical protein C4527_20235 [Candidatus Omnitrophota bacterium]